MNRLLPFAIIVVVLGGAFAGGWYWWHAAQKSAPVSKASPAAEAAGVQGKFWEMHDLLYENQKIWKDAFDTRPIFEGFAGRIGLDVERFKRDQTGDIVEARITRDGIRGHSLGVNGTPTV